MRLCKRVKRGTFRKSFKKDFDSWQWAVNLKPGDLVSTCSSYFNRVVANIKICKSHDETAGMNLDHVYIPKSSRVWEVEVMDTCGFVHYFPGGGCVSDPEVFTPEQVASLPRTNVPSYLKGEFVVDDKGTETFVPKFDT